MGHWTEFARVAVLSIAASACTRVAPNAAGQAGQPASVTAGGTGGAPAANGTSNTTSATAGSGGTNPAPGAGGRSGVVGAAGTTRAAGTSVAGSSGRSSSGGAGDAGGSADAGSTHCGSSAQNSTPFGCKFAWGTNDPGGSLSTLNTLQFVSKWVGYEVTADAKLPSCDGCSWLTQQVTSTQLVPVYYAYFVGYLGHANGFADGNQNPNGPNLTTDGATLIRDHRDALIAIYGAYAQQSANVWKTKPLVWLLEGDFVQYSGTSQKQPLSMAELAKFAADVSCAIKGNMPNAVVAINHSTWNSDDVTNEFWGALKSAGVDYDLVWTTGVANNAGFLEAGTKSDSYNHRTASYAYVHGLTGRNIFVDTSFGLSAMGDSWSGADAATLNARIGDGVVAANVTSAPQSYPATVSALEPKLNATCK